MKHVKRINIYNKCCVTHKTKKSKAKMKMTGVQSACSLPEGTLKESVNDCQPKTEGKKHKKRGEIQ